MRYQLGRIIVSICWGLGLSVATFPHPLHAAPQSATPEKVKYLEPLVMSDRIIASAATLPGKPFNKTEIDFVRYAVEVRKSYAYGQEPSPGLLRLRETLKRSPGLIFDFLVRWEQQAQDCTGTASASLFATFAELAPSYGALRQLVDVRLSSIAQASDSRAAFGFIRCSADPNAINQSDADLLTSIFLGIRYQLEATGTGVPFTVKSDQVLAKISQPALRTAVARLGDKVRSTGVAK